jgi:geranylgeranyl pyrophosphate synthase
VTLAALYDGALDGPSAEFLARPAKRFRARLVELSFAAAGGRGDLGRELGDAIERIHAGSLIVDDIEDGSLERRGGPAVHIAHGLPVALNLANWLYFAGLERLLAAAPAAIVPRLATAAIAALRTCHEGQALDLTASPVGLAAAEVPALVAEVTRKKTATLLELGALAGALAAGAGDALVARLVALGGAIGTALQVLDDVGALACPERRAKGIEDLALGRPTWPWALVAERDPARFAAAAALATAGKVAELGALLALEAPRGRARAGALLADALGAARAIAPAPNPALDELERELVRLQVSYG